MNDRDLEFVDQLRDELQSIRSDVVSLVTEVGPPAVQELVLAQRHIEDARMRLGVAQAYAKGVDPWSNKVRGEND